MKNGVFSEIIKPALSLIIICVAVAALLAGVNSLTADKIAANANNTELQARRSVLTSAEKFDEASCSLDGEEHTYYTGKTAAGETAGYVFTASALSYGGKIKVTVGIDTNGTVAGVNILEISDTPGLGMKAKNESFLNKFTGKSGELTVVKNAAASKNEIVAITSATITSKAVTSCVNQALELYAAVTGKEAA